MVLEEGLTPLSIKVNKDGTIHYRGLMKSLNKWSILDIPKMNLNMKDIIQEKDRNIISAEIEVLKTMKLELIDINEYKRVMELISSHRI